MAPAAGAGGVGRTGSAEAGTEGESRGSAGEGTGEAERAPATEAEAGGDDHRSPKKSARDPGDPPENPRRRRGRLMSAIAEVGCEVSTAPLCDSLGISRATFYRWRRPQPAREPPLPRARHPRSLGPAEHQAILDMLHSERFCDASPAE